MKKTNDVADKVAQQKCSNNKYYVQLLERYIYIYVYIDYLTYDAFARVCSITLLLLFLVPL